MEEEKLTPDEEAYFNSGGEEEIPPEVVKVEEPDVIEEPKEKPESMVPHGALHEERERRKQSDREAKELRDRLAETDKKQAVLAERLEALMRGPEKEPVSFDENPADYLKTGLDTTAQTLEQIQKRLAENDQLTQQQKAEQAFVQSYRMQAQQFSQTQKDFGQAYQHWQQSRAQEYQLAGWPQSEIPNMVAQDEKAFVYRAMQDGVNPAQRIYELSKHRGYKPATSEEQKLDTIEKGQRAKGLGSNGSPPKRLTLETLADMDDDAFAEATKGDNWRKLWS